MTIAEVEKQLIFSTLKRTSDNRTQAADMLGISVRTLRNKLHQYEKSGDSPFLVGEDVKTKKSLNNPITLKQIKKEKKLSHLALVKQGRLSVMPIDKISWNLICELGGI